MLRRLIAPGEQLVAPLLALPNSGCASVCPRPLVVSRIDHHAHVLAFSIYAHHASHVSQTTDSRT